MKSRRLLSVMIACGAIALIAGLSAWTITTRDAHYKQTTDRLEIVIAQSNQAISLILGEVDAHLRAMVSAFAGAEIDNAVRLQGWLSHQSFGGGAFLLNPDGRCHPDNRAAAADCHLLSNAFGDWHRAEGLIWADPVAQDGRWVAGIGRRVVDPAGTVLALAAYSVDTEIILESWRRLGLPDGSAVTLIREDTETLWLRYPFDPTLQNRSIADGPLLTAVRQDGSWTGQTVLTPVNTDGIARMVAWTRLYEVPLLLAAGQSIASIEESWRAIYLPGLMITGAIGLGGLWGTGILLTRSQFRRQMAERRLQRFFALTADLHAVIVRDYRLLQVNEAWTQVLGWRPEMLIGADFIALVAPADREESFACLKPDAPPPTEIALRNRLMTAEGRARWVDWNIHRDAGGMIYASGRDVTEEIARNEALTEAMDAAVTANQAKSAFLANMSHELRTPLNAIIGFTEVMRQSLFGPLGATPETERRYRGYVNDIHDAGTVLLATISDILDLSKLERGGLILEREPVDLTDQIEETVRLLAFEAGRRDLILLAERPDDRVQAMADAKAVGQILRNLVSNALKFTDPGGSVTIALDRIDSRWIGSDRVEEGLVKCGGKDGDRPAEDPSPRTEAVESESEQAAATASTNGAPPSSPRTQPELSPGAYARITVRDTGIGIPADSLTEVLRPFRQVQNHLTRGRSGSGLGLAIASGLAEAMGGTLTLDSTVGVGTVATVVLPVIEFSSCG